MAFYYIDSSGPDFPRLLSRGIAQTLNLAKSSKFRHAAVFVDSKRRVRRNNIWEEAIGKTATKQLADGRTIIDGCTIYLLTERIYGDEFIEGPILAPFVSTKLLKIVLKNYRASDIVYVALAPKELENFKRNNPEAIAF